jgi:ribonuclease Z
MEKVGITFLGTGNAVPTPKRNHTSILLNYKNENILIDCGEGTQRQFKFAGISPSKLTRLLITHWHGDHILGIPGLLQTLAMSGYERTLKIYGPRGTRRYFSLLQELVNITIKTEIHEIENTSIEEPEFIIKTRSMNHDIPTNAYSFIIKDKIRLKKDKLKKLKIPNSPLLRDLQEGKDIVFNNKRIKASQVTYLEKGKKITIILDTTLNENITELTKDSDILIMGATFSDEEKEKAREYKHLTSKQAAEIAKKAKAKKLLLTHLSQRYEHKPQVIEKEAKKIFKNSSLAKDLDKIEV